MQGGADSAILARYTVAHPELPAVLEMVARRVPHKKRQIAPYQGAALYSWAKPYNRPGCQILEIGSFLGYSAAIMASACPMAEITTLNPKHHEAIAARANLRYWPGVRVVEAYSWDYLGVTSRNFDVIFCDGDHSAILRDLPWFDRLVVGGLMAFHDYSPAGTYRECVPVYDALNAMARALGRDFDRKVIDVGNVGMVGFVRQPDDDGWLLHLEASNGSAQAATTAETGSDSGSQAAG
jgi:predicted O-methyltransferase YrrM